jgi:AcrR family transcriptional regulator
MSRPKLISDAAVLAIVRERVLRAGDKAVSFREVGAATGLSAPALVLRFSSQNAMVSAALVAGWQELGTLAQKLAENLGSSPKDVQDFLKAQADVVDIPTLLAHSLRDGPARTAAIAYRELVEGILANCYGGGMKGRNKAGLVFAAMQGRMAWGDAGGKTFRLGEFLRAQT